MDVNQNGLGDGIASNTTGASKLSAAMHWWPVVL